MTDGRTRVLRLPHKNIERAESKGYFFLGLNMEKQEVGLCQGEGANIFQKNTPEVQRAAPIINVCASCPVLMCTICYFFY